MSSRVEKADNILYCNDSDVKVLILNKTLMLFINTWERNLKYVLLHSGNMYCTIAIYKDIHYFAIA